MHAAARRSENQLSGALAAQRLLLFPAGMARYGQPGARTRLFRGGRMRILRSFIIYGNTGQVGALPDIKGQPCWPLRFPGRRDRRRRGRLLSTVRTGLVLITHRSHPLRQSPGVPVDSRANPPPRSTRPLRRDLARAGGNRNDSLAGIAVKLGEGDAEFEKLLGKFIVAAPGAHRVRGDAGLAGDCARLRP